MHNYCLICSGEGLIESHEQPINYPLEKMWERCEECNGSGLVDDSEIFWAEREKDQQTRKEMGHGL